MLYTLAAIAALAWIAARRAHRRSPLAVAVIALLCGGLAALPATGSGLDATAAAIFAAAFALLGGGFAALLLGRRPAA